ncbi:MAG: ABC transporter ATP-binding protein [Rhodospirillaceae bacterium]|nr:ABC transporter ATP-binding protein [Rhodospirillaceae bacterium]
MAVVGVGHRYGPVVALDDVSLSVAHGEIVSVVGPSGCGKSTLLRVTAGLEDVQAGEVHIGGRRMAGGGDAVPPERRGVGLVFQDYALFPHLSVLDNVAFGLTGQAPPQRRRRAAACLEQVGMAGFAKMYPHTLSGGQQQRVALARALAPEPHVMLLDEPFSGLDVLLRDRVRDETLHVLKRAGTSTLLVTHDPEEAMFLSDRIALMARGRIVQAGPPAELYCYPQTPFVARFFGEVNQIPGRVEGAKVTTPAGPVDAPDLPAGTPVDVLIRPEALSVGLGAAAGGVAAEVMAARLLGRTSLVHLRMEGGEAGPIHLHARVPGVFLPAEGTAVSIGLDPRQAFVFPSGAGDDTGEDLFA